MVTHVFVVANGLSNCRWCENWQRCHRAGKGFTGLCMSQRLIEMEEQLDRAGNGHRWTSMALAMLPKLKYSLGQQKKPIEVI